MLTLIWDTHDFGGWGKAAMAFAKLKARVARIASAVVDLGSAAFICSVPLTASSAHAQTVAVPTLWDGNKLQAACSGTTSTTLTMCATYIFGVIDGVRVMEASFMAVSVTHQSAFCIPDGVSIGQLKDVVALYLNEHPEQRHYAAAGLVLAAVSGAFPCSK
jgi:hypothetical protein